MRCKGCEREYIGMPIETTNTVCEYCGANNNVNFELKDEEVKVLDEFLKTLYISYENHAMLDLMKRIRVHVEQYELAKSNNKGA